MTQWAIFAIFVVGAPLGLLLLAVALPCEGCRLRRERIARALAKLRTGQSRGQTPDHTKAD